MPMVAGSQPAAAHPARKPSGSRLSGPSRSSATTRQAAAASFCWLALPAVTVPPGVIVRSLASVWGVESGRTPSSRRTVTGLPDHHGRGDDGLQPTAAAPVDLEAGHADRQVRVQRRPPTQAWRLAVDVGLGERDVVDELRVDPGPVQDGLDGGGGEVLDGDIAQAPAECADRGPHGRDDRGPAYGHRAYLALSSDFTSLPASLRGRSSTKRTVRGAL